MAFEDHHVGAALRQQQTEHETGWSSADDACVHANLVHDGPFLKLPDGCEAHSPVHRHAGNTRGPNQRGSSSQLAASSTTMRAARSSGGSISCELPVDEQRQPGESAGIS